MPIVPRLRTNDGAIRLASSQDMCFGQVRGLRAGADQQVPDPWQPRSIEAASPAPPQPTIRTGTLLTGRCQWLHGPALLDQRVRVTAR